MVIIVLGCHRSGTSAVAGTLYHLGVDMGTLDLVETPGNKKGYFEDKDFYKLHEKMLAMQLKEVNINFEPFREEYVKLIRSKEKPLWGLKDPKLCFLFPYFQEITQFEIKIINVERPLNRSAISFVVREQMRGGWEDASYANVFKMLERYQDSKQKILESFDGEVLTISYDDLVENPEIINDLAEFVNLPLNEEAKRFIDPSLRHI